MASIQVDLTELTSNLEQVQQKFMKQWTGSSLDQFLEQHHMAQEEWLKEATDEINRIKDNLEQLQQESQNNREVIAQQKRKAEELQSAIEEAKSKKQRLMFQKEQDINEVQEKKAKVKNEKELLEAQEKATQLRLVELQKAEGFFKDRTGLQFKKIDSDNLQFVFTQLDPKDHDKCYYFTVKMVEKVYNITDCSPSVEGLPDLVQRLNETNNLMQFVVQMRKKFKQTVT